MIAAEKKLYTYDDYVALTPPDSAQFQLIEGELVEMPSPIVKHQRVQRELGFALLLFIKQKDLGELFYAPMDVYLSPTNTYQPDILFISNERRNIIGEKRIDAAPDLVVEILSPGTAYYDLKKKRRNYEAFGVRELWFVDPADETVEIYEGVNGKFQLVAEAQSKGSVVSKLLPEFSIALETLFE
jgi:Uma2 family endonuclease